MGVSGGHIQGGGVVSCNSIGGGYLDTDNLHHKPNPFRAHKSAWQPKFILQGMRDRYCYYGGKYCLLYGSNKPNPLIVYFSVPREVIWCA